MNRNMNVTSLFLNYVVDRIQHCGKLFSFQKCQDIELDTTNKDVKFLRIE